MRHAFTLTYLNHALLSHISALGAHRETKMREIENISEMANRVIVILNKAGMYLSENKHENATNLSPMLLELKKQIIASDSNLKKQQLRLFYNVVGATEKIIKELQETWMDSKNQN